MNGIKVFAPASVGNCIVGFDALGFALDRPGDEVIARFSDEKGLRIIEITGAKGKLPYEVEKNTASIAALALLRHLGEEDRGIDLTIHKKMPFGSGLGSSAASAVAGAFAVNELLRRPLEKRDLLPFAMEGEQYASGGYHADNVAPSLLGGMTLVRDSASLDVHRVFVPQGLFITVVHPKVEILTKDARAILADTVSLHAATQQAANMGAFIIGMHRTDFDLIKRSLQDVLIEPQRSKLIPGFDAVKAAALEAGALGCSISGSGPSIFAISPNSLVAEEVAKGMEGIYDGLKINCTVYQSGINMEGAQVC